VQIGKIGKEEKTAPRERLREAHLSPEYFDPSLLLMDLIRESYIGWQNDIAE